MILYISGPMTGRPQFNFPLFDQVAKELLAQGYEVISPAEHDRTQFPTIGAPGFDVGDVKAWSEAVGFDYRVALQWDLEHVLAADGIVMLPEWETSRGAKTERFVAEAVGKKVFLARPGQVPLLVFDEEQRMTLGVGRGGANRAPKPVTSTTYVDPTTGGAKGVKDVEYGRIPDSLEEVAKHFHDGAQKYRDVAPGVANWSLGYPWSLSIEALNRHLKAWERGEDCITDDDPTQGNNHLAAVAFHALVLLWFQKHGVGTDDRRTLAARERYLASQK